MKLKKRHELDLLNGTIWDKLLLFALPLAATSILQQLFNAADIAVVGRFVGESAMAAVGSNSSTINLLVNLFVGMSLGTNVIISQMVGRQDSDGIRRAVSTSVIAAVAGGLLVAVGVQPLVGGILTALSVPDDVYGMAMLYLRIYMAGLPAILLYNFETAIFRSQGDTKTPLLVLTVSGVINVVLNAFFVLVVGLTVDGVALATVASNLISAETLFIILSRRQSAVRIDIHRLCFDGAIFRRIMAVGIPAGVQGMVFSIANICVQSCVNSLGSVVMAASSAAYNLEAFSYQTLAAFGQACTTFVGQNYGAGKLTRCHRIAWVALLTGAVFFAAIAGLLLLGMGRLLAIFNRNPEVIYFGTIRLRYMLLGHVFSLFVEVLSGYLRGFGLSALPAGCALVFICGIRIFWVYTVFPNYRTFANLMTVYPISLSATACILAVVCLLVRKTIHAPTQAG